MSGRERHLLLVLRYRGTRYHGFQVQKNAPSVAAQVQDAVERIFKARLPVKGCSRTDAGVHARHFALTLRTDASIAPASLVRAMNVNLPDDIAVLACREVPGAFHPRYDCAAKRYCYRIWNDAVKDPFGADLALHYPHPLPLVPLGVAAQGFLGRHNFTSFCAAGSAVEDRTREIMQANVTRDGCAVNFTVTGDGFLYHMVRIMTGTLLDVARGAIAPDAVPAILEKRDRGAAGFTAPPHGLYLEDVWYPAAALGLEGGGTAALSSLCEAQRGKN